VHKNQIDLTHQVEGPNDYRNYRQYDSHKTINPQGGFQEEEEDSPEDSREAEDSQEVGDIQEEVAYHQEVLLEAHGGHPRSQYHKHKPENW